MYALLQQTGDEMSKRSKFLLVTWVGLGVSPIKKAKMSTDKALVKEVLAVSFISCKDQLIHIFKPRIKESDTSGDEVD